VIFKLLTVTACCFFFSIAVTTYCNDMICDCSLQLKVDMIKLIEVFGASKSEFSSVIIVVNE